MPRRSWFRSTPTRSPPRWPSGLSAWCRAGRDDPEANLSGFANPADGGVDRWGDRIDGLAEAGSEDISLRRCAASDRYVQRDGMHYLVPTIVRCDSIDHPLANPSSSSPTPA